ncbi:GNAT family N-acetyltransferase [Streptomyces sp. NPDC087844]|uniref:GNAT family N-acetyltransferase n=1 Tax=Streptomyces sp. NPDC087844 TaxID=3365805 RepID=UPI0037FA03AB
MQQLMEAAVAVGIPAAEHAHYFAVRLYLTDADSAEEWDYDDHEIEINEDRWRLLSYVGMRPVKEPAPTSRGAARQIGPLDPLQLPGSPDHLLLDYRCTLDALPSWRSENNIEYWHVGVHHRLPDGAETDAERELGQVGRLVLAKAVWGQDPQVFDPDNALCVGVTAAAAFDAVDNPHSPIHRLGVGQDGDLLLLLQVELDPAWRGFGLGAILTRQALDVLGRDCRVVATGVDGTDSPAGRLAQAAGFHRVGPGLMVLDRSRQDEQTALLRRLHCSLLVSLSSPYRNAEPPF